MRALGGFVGRPIVAALAVLAALALGMGGCGGGGGGEERPAAPPDAEPEAPANPYAPRSASMSDLADDPPPAAEPARETGDGGLVVPLAEQDASGQDGTVTLTPVGEGRTRVLIEVSNPPPEPQPAHIHPGTCAVYDDPFRGLHPVEDGRSETVVDVRLEELRAGLFVINVHRSTEQIDVVVACGTMPSASAT